jgi:pyruvate kinase
MRILILEDAKATQVLVKKRLEKQGHVVAAVDNGHQGFQLAISKSYDVIISDIHMPHWDGFKFIEAMQVVNPHVPIIIVSSSHDDPEVIEKTEKAVNAIALLAKPLDFEKLFELLSTMQVQADVGVENKSRIVCTIGPSSNDEATLGKMIVAGMDVARLNFSHGTHEQHSATLEAVRAAERNWYKPIAVLQDLCGPKIRTGKMDDGKIVLSKGGRLIIQREEIVGNPERISTITPEILDDLEIGDPILLDDGLLELKVIEITPDMAVCQIIVGGTLKSSKGMNLPATSLSLPSVTDKDWQDLDWALNHEVDYVALSFVRTAEEILQIKKYIADAGNTHLRVVAKVEKPEAVKNIKEIITAADAIMIARGDMGVELPAARVPRIQKEIIRLCRDMNTPVITATQMLDSMTTNARPTRAEVTDVSTAISEGSDAVMLSQETATGIDPVNVVRTMASIIYETENYDTEARESCSQTIAEDPANPILSAVASFRNISATILLDLDGELYPLLSKWSRVVPSLLVTRSRGVARQSSLYKNMIPLVISEEGDRDTTVFKAMEMAVKMGYIRVGDVVAVVDGKRLTKAGINQSSRLQLVTVPEIASEVA